MGSITTLDNRSSLPWAVILQAFGAHRVPAESCPSTALLKTDPSNPGTGATAPGPGNRQSSLASPHWRNPQIHPLIPPASRPCRALPAVLGLALLASHGLQARAIHGDRLNLAQFRLLVNYFRPSLGQSGGVVVVRRG